MKTIRRYDSGGALLRMHRRASDGVLLVEGYARREGVLRYRNADGSEHLELVTREAVEDTARTLPRAAVTLAHPPEFISPANSQEYGVGDVDGSAVIEETAQGGFVRVSMAVRRADAIDAVRKGTRELSVGYDVTIDPTPGVHPVYGRYDARQIGCDCNHLAIVEKGRAGPAASLRLDSDDRATTVTGWPAAQPDEGPSTREDHMNPRLVQLLTLLGVQHTDSEDAALDAGIAAFKAHRADAARLTDARVDGLTADKAAADATAEQLRTDLETMQGERDALQAKVDALEGDEKARKDAADLADLQSVAKHFDVASDGLDLAALRLAVAKTRVDSVDAETPPAVLDGILAVVRVDASRADGLDAGAKAWASTGLPKVRKDADDDGNEPVETATMKQLKRKDAAFKAAGGTK